MSDNINPNDPSGYQNQGYPARLNQPLQGYGTPANPYQQQPGVDLASTGARIGGFLIDLVVTVTLAFLLTFSWLTVSTTLTGPNSTSTEVNFGITAYALMGVLWFVYYVAPTAVFGKTLGKKMVGTKVVRVGTAQAPGWGWAFVRHLVLSLLNGFCGIPQLLNAIFLGQDTERQGWHDKVARTHVLNVR